MTICVKAGDTEKAIRHLRRVFEINPTSELGLQILAPIFQGPKKFAVSPEKIKK